MTGLNTETQRMKTGGRSIIQFREKMKTTKRTIFSNYNFLINKVRTFQFNKCEKKEMRK